MARISHFECSRCGKRVDAEAPRGVCPECVGPLYVRYDLESLRKSTSRDRLLSRPAAMWRYADVLPEVGNIPESAPPSAPETLGTCDCVSLQEGYTALLTSRTKLKLFLKDEGRNPTGSIEARGMSVAVSMARAYGIRKLALASHGRDAAALAAYASAAGMEAHVFMPRNVQRANVVECETYGACVTLVDGLKGDCARRVAERSAAEGWFDVSGLGAFRLEGAKIIGYEIAEQMGWKLPDVVVCPIRDGLELAGITKAFDEMEVLGWLPSGIKRPKMFAVTSETYAGILEVKDEVGRVGYDTVAVTDCESMEALRDWARIEGMLASPEGASSLAGYRKLVAQGVLKADDTVVLLNTGSGLRYLDEIAGKPEQPRARAIGGIIQPY